MKKNEELKHCLVDKLFPLHIMKKKLIVLLLLVLCFCGCADAAEDTVVSEMIEGTSEEAASVVPEEVTDSAETHATEETSVTEEVFLVNYETAYLEAPHVVYKWQDWLNANRELHFPKGFEEQREQYDSYYERLACFYVPEEALENATTLSLLDIAVRCPYYSASIYNFPSEYIELSSSFFNAIEELWNREGITENILEQYEQEVFAEVWPYDTNVGREVYMKEAYCVRDRILTEEILLASDRGFEEMDEAMRLRTLKAVEEKLQQNGTNDYVGYEGTCAFYFYIAELHEYRGGSKWYDYIAKSEEYSYLTEKITTLNLW